MTADTQQRRAVLSCFWREPIFDQFLGMTASDRNSLLRWLDESGLAIYLAQRLVEHGLWEQIDTDLQQALDERRVANRQRTFVLLREFERVNIALQSAGVEYAILKGFTLTPEFCPEPWLRHQSDIDLLMSSREVSKATKCLDALGYKLEPGEGSGELCLAIRSEHVPSSEDFIYDAPRSLHVEIHSEFYQPSCGVALDVGRDWSENIEWRVVEGVPFPGIDLPHRFLLQVLHVFRHIQSWARVAWLYEIARFVEQFEGDEEFWFATDSLIHDDVRIACGIVCSIVTNAFGTRFPPIIQENWIQPLPARQVSWLCQHAEMWLLSDFAHASKTGLLLHREYARSGFAWWSYRWARYRKIVPDLYASRQAGPRFLIERARRHMDYLWQSLKWSARH